MNFINYKTNDKKVLNFVVALEAGGEKCPKTFFEVLERQNLKN